MAENSVLNPVLKKLRVKPGQRAIVLGTPESYRPVLAEMPDGVVLESELKGEFDFIHCFVTKKSEVERRVGALKSALKPGGLLWVSYPKGKAIATDLNRDILWQLLRGYGLEGVAMVAIDDVWAAMRFKAA